MLFVDESRWPLLGVDGKGAASTKWHIWTLVSDLGVYYEIYDGRDADSAEDLLAGFQGYVMCDGFSVYEALAGVPRNSAWWRCACAAQLRGVLDGLPHRVQILDLIGKLYDREARRRG
ncbi:MAG: transposase [Byssovorax sp.]